jgi:hypothetical protein
MDYIKYEYLNGKLTDTIQYRKIYFIVLMAFNIQASKIFQLRCV